MNMFQIWKSISAAGSGGGTPTSVVQYVYFSDGTLNVRKGVRTSVFVVDKTLTVTGFSGDENIDWVNIKSVE